MSTLTHPSTPDELDRRLSDFFKAQLPRSWPKAPAIGAAPIAEPAGLVAAQNRPTRRDHSSRSRLTLAASVALLLGTCWYLSNGYTPGERNSGGPGAAPTNPMLNKGSAAGSGALFDQMQKNNTDKQDPAFDPNKVKIEE